MSSPVGYPQGNSLKMFTDETYGAGDIPVGVPGKNLTPIYAIPSDGVVAGSGERIASLSASGESAIGRPVGMSIAGSHLEVRGQKFWTPGDTLVDGGGGTGTGSIVVSDRADIQGWKITLDPGTANSKINAQRAIVGASPIASTDVIWVRFFVPSWAAGMEATLYVSSLTNWTKYAFGGWGMNQIQEGWNELPLLASSMTVYGGEVFPLTPQVVRLQVKNTAGAGGVIYADRIAVAQAMPTCLLTFDDGYADLIRYAYPIMARNGLRGTAFICSGWTDAQEAGTMADNTCARWRDLRMLYDQGWDIGCHTTGHRNAISYAEVGTISSGGTTATFTSGGTSGDYPLNFVSGGQLVFDRPRGISLWSAGNDTGRLCTIMGVVAGEPTVERIMMRNATFAVSALEWDSVSRVVLGSASAGVVTLRACYNSAEYAADVSISRDRILANGMPRAANWFAWPRGEFSKPIRDALLRAGFLLRGTVEYYGGNIFGGKFLGRDIHSYSAGGTRTLADIQTHVGKIQDAGGIGSVFWHHVNPNPATLVNTLPSVLTPQIEYFAAECYAGNLRCPTFSQLDRTWV